MLTSCILPSETWINTGIFPMQIEQRVHFDGSLLLAKLRPGKQRQAEIDGGRVQRVDACWRVADGWGGEESRGPPFTNLKISGGLSTKLGCPTLRKGAKDGAP